MEFTASVAEKIATCTERRYSYPEDAESYKKNRSEVIPAASLLGVLLQLQATCGPSCCPVGIHQREDRATNVSATADIDVSGTATRAYLR